MTRIIQSINNTIPFFFKTNKWIKFFYLSIIVLLVLISGCYANSSNKLTHFYSGLGSPTGMAFNSKGDLFVTDWSRSEVLKISSNGKSEVWIQVSSPSGIAIDSDDTIYVASYSKGIIYKSNAKGKKQQYLKGFGTPAGLSFDLKGNLLVADRGTNQILSFDSKGNKKVVAEKLRTPVGIVQTGDGSYYISNFNGGIDLLNKNGIKTISRDFGNPAVGIVTNSKNEVFVADYGGTSVKKVTQNGTVSIIADSLSSPVALAITKEGVLYVGAWGNGTIYKISN